MAALPKPCSPPAERVAWRIQMLDNLPTNDEIEAPWFKRNVFDGLVDDLNAKTIPCVLGGSAIPLDAYAVVTASVKHRKKIAGRGANFQDLASRDNFSYAAHAFPKSGTVSIPAIGALAPSFVIDVRIVSMYVVGWRSRSCDSYPATKTLNNSEASLVCFVSGVDALVEFPKIMGAAD